MKHSWFYSVIPIAAIFSFRMLGLFMLIPVFTVFAANLHGATPALMGVALGCYGLSQGILQIPFGILSDKFGRKPLLTIGLLLFASGSLLGAFSHSIYMMILARTLQGTGAIGSVLIALLADLTPDEQRTKAMAVIGMTIGLSFSLAMIISPAITQRYGLASIFYLTTFLALLGLFLLHRLIPTPTKEHFPRESGTKPSLLKTVITNPHLQRLNLGIFLQHLILTATFYAIPLLLQQQLNYGHSSPQCHFYLPIMVFSFIGMIPFIFLAERKQLMKPVFLFSVLAISLSQIFLALANQYWLALCILAFLYFIAFNILEATLPSLISKQADISCKGTAMGVYSSCQFLGIFAGGTLAGVLYQWGGNAAIFTTNGFLALFWFVVSFSMKPDAYISTLILVYHKIPSHELIIQLKELAGVREVLLAKKESAVYIRINKAIYKGGSAEELLFA